ncbi:MAG: hypothetical protein WBQ73_03015 [Candidatus Babeliales bacterium]
MEIPKKRILLKLTGELFVDTNQSLTASLVNHVIDQMKQLETLYQFALVIGGGNFFRDRTHGKMLGIKSSIGHQIGMMATIMNGLILKDLLEQKNISATILCAMPAPEIGEPISQQAISDNLNEGHTLIFTGGTGNPFFTTDTNAVLRSLQIDADFIYKGTKVNGVFTADPMTNPSAKKLPTVTYREALAQKLAVMDPTAFVLAEQHNKIIRVFNIFEKDGLLKTVHDASFGSIITP